MKNGSRERRDKRNKGEAVVGNFGNCVRGVGVVLNFTVNYSYLCDVIL